MLAEFLLQNAFLAGATVFLGGATVYMWSQSGDGVSVNVHETVMKVNQVNALVVDLRGKADYDKAHVPGSRHVNASEVEDRAKDLAKRRPLVLVCANGQASAAKARALRQAGVEDVSALKGGIRSWLDSGQPTHKRK